MATKTEDLILIPMTMELEEVPAPGTSPEAPDGPAYVTPEEEEESEDDPDVWTDPDGNTDGFSIPPKKGEDLL